MDTQKFVGILVFGVIGVVLLSAFVPIISETTSATDTFENKTGSLYYVDEITADSPDYTMSYTAGATTLKINGVDVVRKSGTIICDLGEYLIRDRGSSIQWVDPDGNITFGDSVTSFELTIISGNVTAIRSTGGEPIGSPLEFAMTDGYVIMPSGAYVMKAPTQNAYVLKDSPITAMGLTTINGEWRTLFQITGTVDNIEVVNLNDTYDIENVVVDYATVSGYIDLFTINKVTFDAVNKEDSTITQSCTYNYFIVPAEVTAEKTYHPDSTMSAVLDLLPLVVGFGLLLFIVAEFLYRRYL